MPTASHLLLLTRNPSTGEFFYSKVSFTNLPCRRVSGYIKHAKSSPNCSIVAGGGFDESVGYFIEPTIVQTTTPEEKIFQEEIFGPVVTVYVYKDADAKETMQSIIKHSPYSLTGALYCQDQVRILKLTLSISKFFLLIKLTASCRSGRTWRPKN